MVGATEQRTDRYLIVGAGPSGLAAMRSFDLAGVPYDAVDLHHDVGGIWDQENPGSPMYDSAHFISCKQWSSFVDLPFPEECPDYPRHRDVLDYIRSYAEHFGLREKVEFGQAVSSARPSEDGSAWLVEMGSGEARSYRGVVACPGFQRVPNVPELPGSFSGRTIHSQDYGSLSELEGQRVVVVGAGNSGVDIVCDAATVGRAAHLSMRRGYWFFPKHVHGLPLEFYAIDDVEDPEELRAWLNEVVGDLTRFGLPAPEHPPLAHHPIINSQVLHHVSHGDLDVRPDIERLDGDTIHFVDGSSVEADVLILATGYHDVVPFVDESHLQILPDSRSDLFFLTFHRRYPNFFVSGIANINSSGYYDLNATGDLIASHILLENEDPARFERLRRLIAETTPDLSGPFSYYNREGHGEYVNSRAATEYADWLCSEFGLRLRSFEGETALEAEKLSVAADLARFSGAGAGAVESAASAAGA